MRIAMWLWWFKCARCLQSREYVVIFWTVQFTLALAMRSNERCRQHSMCFCFYFFESWCLMQLNFYQLIVMLLRAPMRTNLSAKILCNRNSWWTMSRDKPEFEHHGRSVRAKRTHEKCWMGIRLCATDGAGACLMWWRPAIHCESNSVETVGKAGVERCRCSAYPQRQPWRWSLAMLKDIVLWRLLCSLCGLLHVQGIVNRPYFKRAWFRWILKSSTWPDSKRCQHPCNSNMCSHMRSLFCADGLSGREFLVLFRTVGLRFTASRVPDHFACTVRDVGNLRVLHRGDVVNLMHARRRVITNKPGVTCVHGVCFVCQLLLTTCCSREIRHEMSTSIGWCLLPGGGAGEREKKRNNGERHWRDLDREREWERQEQKEREGERLQANTSQKIERQCKPGCDWRSDVWHSCQRLKVCRQGTESVEDSITYIGLYVGKATPQVCYLPPC